ncbi:MAG: TetR/AcrR family transcriptional regulator [Reyranella sp.]|uniref:TetR/AcrR family transcriptional regulator n=1 Tax=Reyranella sp. TaxID=1929291 RepID=UPI003D139D9B
MKTPAPARPYESPLRQAQAALTRERILMAAKDFLERDDIEKLTLRHLAELAGVSPPTVYAHFATVDDLVAAFFAWLKPRLGLDKPLPPLDQLGELPVTLFPAYEAYGALLRNLMNKPSWDRQRMADRNARHGGWITEIGEALPDLTPEQLRRGALVMAAFWTPTVWRWLMDTCGFQPKEAELVASWAINTLAEGLRRDASGLADRPHAKAGPGRRGGSARGKTQRETRR